MPRSIAPQTHRASLYFPPYPSKEIDYMTLTDSQFYERVGKAMNISDITQARDAIQSLESDPSNARVLFQQLEHEDAEAEVSPPLTSTLSPSPTPSPSPSSTPTSITPPPATSLPLYPSKLVDYSKLTEAQFHERVRISMNLKDITLVPKVLQTIRGPERARQLYQELEYLQADIEETGLRFSKKPMPGEKVIYAELKDNVTIRLWRGGLESMHAFTYCFVYSDNRELYRIQPENVKVYSRLHGKEIIGWETSMEQVQRKYGNMGCFENQKPLRDFDPNWVTYVVAQGTTLDIYQGNYPRVVLQVPTDFDEQFAPISVTRA